MQKQKKDSRNNFVAGSVAGSAAVVFLHPFDVVKTRLQVQDGFNQLPTYKGTRHAMRTMYATEGLAGFYRGWSPALFGSAVAWGAYFFLYDTIQRYNKRWQNTDRLSPAWNFLSAAQAGSLVCVLTNPIWLVKTRLQLQQAPVPRPLAAAAPAGDYRGMWDALVRISREEGVRGLFKGLGPSLIVQSTHGAVQLAVYEELKHAAASWRNRRRPAGSDSSSRKADEASSLEVSLYAATSKLAAALTTYPFQVVRSRLQQRFEGRALVYRSTAQVVRVTLQREGVAGFYKGLLPSLLRTMPQSALTFLVYEACLRALNRHFPNMA